MELPHIGEHCSDVTCRQLDFLPYKCSFCKNVYCRQHQTPSAHQCPQAAAQDVRVPVCPLCNKAVPAPRGQAPDIAISKHLDDNCKVKKQRIYENRCSHSGCRTKELMPIKCYACGLNYCIPHRHPIDHACIGPSPVAAAPPAAPSDGGRLQAIRDQAAARMAQLSAGFASRNANNPGPYLSARAHRLLHGNPNTAPPPPSFSASVTAARLQGGLSEDEALAMALSQSAEQQTTPPATPPATSSTTSTTTAAASNSSLSPTDEVDDQLQRAIAASLRDANNTAPSSSKSDCSIV